MELTASAYIQATHQGFGHAYFPVLAFGGRAPVAFRREHDGLRVGGPLALGLALMLPLAALQWSREEGRRIALLDPFADFVIAQAMLSMCCAALRKGTRDWHCGSR
jgi:hypothetical protein